jgi:AraC-like DNA-binding protein
MWGIGFLPLGWARFVDVDASGLANQIFDGTQHPAFARFAEVGDIAASAAMDLAEQFEMIVAAMRKFMRPHRNEERILRVHRALVEQQPSSVAQFAESTELSVRGLERICARHFGFTPKTLIRRQRFMRSLTAFMLQKDSKWTAVIDEHYHDQAQFSREFRAFMGMSPSEYADQEHPFLDSFVEARTRMLGSAALTLDRPA